MILSFIIPVYNTEKYLEKCVDSILIQGLNSNDYEVILINDGSTDNSQKIIDDYVLKYDHFKSVVKNNGGLSSARNYGIKISKGEYIYFIDSDDYLDGSGLLNMMSLLTNKQPDLLSFNFRKVNEAYEEISRVSLKYPVNTYFTGESALNSSTVVSNVWKYLFKRSVIEENELYFTDGIYHEDEEFTTLYIAYSTKIIHVPFCIYSYLQRASSIMNDTDKHKRMKKIKDTIVVVQNLKNKSSDFPLSLKKGINIKIEQLLITVFLRMKSFKLNYIEVTSIIDELKNKGLYPIITKNYKIKLLSLFLNNSYFIKLFYK